MPHLSADRACPKEKLSDRFWHATEWERKVFTRLGFGECLFSKIERHVNPMYLDTGGITYLHRDRWQIGFLNYVKLRVPSPVNQVRENITISFAAAFHTGSLTVTNEKRYYDPPPGREKMLVQSRDPAVIHQKFEGELQKRGLTPRVFSDSTAALQWIDERSLEAFEDHVTRGLYVKMSDEEVEQAQRAMQEPPILNPPKSRVRWVFVFAAALAVFVLAHRLHPGGSRDVGGDTTIPYRGETFKMSKRYESYEDYKDDPNNLDTNELPRIEQVMTRARIPRSFPSDAALAEAVFDLAFPGYGCGGLGRFPQSDGSTCTLFSVEIPMRDKERYFVGRTATGRVYVVDDFVFESATDQITRVEVRGTKLQYFDRSGSVVREKQF